MMGRTERKPNHSTISAVVPVYNEADNLSWFLPKLKKYVDEIILVDGNSTDNTVEIAKELAPNAKILHQEGDGKGNALKLGLKHVSGDYIVTIDADCSHDPAEIPHFITPLRNDYDVVKGSRLLGDAGSADLTPLRLVGNLLFVKLSNLVHGTEFTDLCYGFVAFKREALEKFTINATEFNIEAEMAIRMHKAGLKIIETPSFEKKRRHGETNLSPIIQGVKILLTIFQEAPLIKRELPKELTFKDILQKIKKFVLGKT